MFEVQQSYALSGLVVPNRDSSVAVVILKGGRQPAGYSGVTATNVRNDLVVSPGWERAGATLYVPLVKDNYYDRTSTIYITNVGLEETQIDVEYRNTAGQLYPGARVTLQPNVRTMLHPQTYIPDGVYSARIVNSPGFNQPLAAVVLEQGRPGSSSDWPVAYNAFSSGNTILYAPLVKNNYVGHTTGITLQNITDSATTFEARYYDMEGNQQGPTVVGVISSYSPYVLYNPDGIPTDFYGSVRINSRDSKALVGQVSENNGSGGRRLMSNLATGGAKTIHLSLWYDNYNDGSGSNWVSGINILNVYSLAQSITATWYDLSGTMARTETGTLINANDAVNFYDTALTGFVGSLVVTANNGPIVAVSSVRDLNGPVGSDTAMAINGSNR